MKTSPSGPARWMVVDDDRDSSWLMQRMLNLLTGAEVLCYNSSEAALSAIAVDPHGFKLVITDFNMPIMNGDELRERLRHFSPDLKIVLVTGNPDWNHEIALSKGFDGFLAKPFFMDKLCDVALAVVNEPLSVKAA